MTPYRKRTAMRLTKTPGLPRLTVPIHARRCTIFTLRRIALSSLIEDSFIVDPYLPGVCTAAIHRPKPMVAA